MRRAHQDVHLMGSLHPEMTTRMSSVRADIYASQGLRRLPRVSRGMPESTEAVVTPHRCIAWTLERSPEIANKQVSGQLGVIWPLSVKS